MSNAIRPYTGIWINWSHGAIRGATLTLPQEHAGILTAFLAIFVSFAGGMFWSIVRFAVHQAYTTEPSQLRDALHYRRQVILRNTGTGAGAAAWAFVKLSLDHWHTASRPILRSLPFAALAAFNLLLFSVSSLFTSYITKIPGNSTIILGPSCGGYAFTHPVMPSVVVSKSLADTYNAATYVRQCYQNSSSRLNCGTFVRPSLPFSVSQNASCPFAPGLCIGSNHSAFQMDTGLLDSHVDFGINAPPEIRIKYRRVTTCAPIYGHQFITTGNDSIDGLTIYVNAGPDVSLGLNHTFSYIQHTSYDHIGYTLSAINALSDPTGAFKGMQWEPDPSLNQTDADITLMMLSQNSMAYLKPSDDPWMPAHNQVTNTSWGGDYQVNLLGCIDQYQICNPNKAGYSGCTKLAGLQGVVLEMDTRQRYLDLSLAQSWTSGRFLWTGIYRNMFNAVQGRGAAALNAVEKSYNRIQTYIPPTQWQLELSIWFTISLAKEQFWSIEWATAPQNLPPVTPGQDPGWSLNPPTDASGRSQCGNQLIHDATTQSFSIVGMALTLIIGGVIIIVGLTVDTVVGWLRGERAKYKKDQWMFEDMLELHKAAYLGLGLWRDDGSGMVPSSALYRHPPLGSLEDGR